MKKRVGIFVLLILFMVSMFLVSVNALTNYCDDGKIRMQLEITGDCYAKSYLLGEHGNEVLDKSSSCVWRREWSTVLGEVSCTGLSCTVKARYGTEEIDGTGMLTLTADNRITGTITTKNFISATSTTEQRFDGCTSALFKINQVKEVCNNCIDDDADGLTDCLDIYDCSTKPYCQGSFSATSSENIILDVVTENCNCDYVGNRESAGTGILNFVSSGNWVTRLSNQGRGLVCNGLVCQASSDFAGKTFQGCGFLENKNGNPSGTLLAINNKLTDCDCKGWFFVNKNPEICDNGRDDNNDGRIDCGDNCPDCKGKLKVVVTGKKDSVTAGDSYDVSAKITCSGGICENVLASFNYKEKTVTSTGLLGFFLALKNKITGFVVSSSLGLSLLTANPQSCGNLKDYDECNPVWKVKAEKAGNYDNYITAAGIYQTAESEHWNLEVAESPKKCEDSDGKDYSKKGQVYYTLDGISFVTKQDSCTGTIVNEYYCENNMANKIAYQCPENCYDGKCVSSCYETDSGDDKSNAGIISYFKKGIFSSSPKIYTDSCNKAGTKLTEYYCLKSGTSWKVKSKTYKCVCKNGACA